jgi:hypothetical protein
MRAGSSVVRKLNLGYFSDLTGNRAVAFAPGFAGSAILPRGWSWFRPVRPFTIGYRLVARNLPVPFEGKLHVRVNAESL